jgi:hypothetical protein
MIYIEVYLTTIMKQIQQIKYEQDTVSLDRSIGNLFEEFLELNGKTAQGDFDQYAEIVMVSVLGEDGERVFLRELGGFPSSVQQILKMVIKAKDLVGLKFHPKVAGG